VNEKKKTERMIAAQDGHVEGVLLETSGTRTGGKSSWGGRNGHPNSIMARDLRCKDAPRECYPAKRLPQSCIPPIGDCLYKKLLNLFYPFANVSLKRNLSATENGYILLQYVVSSQKMKIDGSMCGRKDTVDRE
jgi:hypothetical protein